MARRSPVLTPKQAIEVAVVVKTAGFHHVVDGALVAAEQMCGKLDPYLIDIYRRCKPGECFARSANMFVTASSGSDETRRALAENLLRLRGTASFREPARQMLGSLGAKHHIYDLTPQRAIRAEGMGIL